MSDRHTTSHALPLFDAPALAPTLTAFFDGDCPLCKREIDYYRGCDGADRIQWVDINRDGCSRIQVLPGIGPARAEAIVEYRTRHGPYQRPEDLTRVPGIGPGLVEIMLPFLNPVFSGRGKEQLKIEEPVEALRCPGRSES